MSEHMPKFNDIVQFPRAHYEVDVAWRYVEDTLQSWADTSGGMGGLDLSPDYQRAHVWTREQQTAYVEYQLRGGEVGRQIIWNSPDWFRGYMRPTELVDGKQRLEAVRAFMRDEFPVFGHLFSEFTDKISNLLTFKFRVCLLETREEILQLYLNINAGGTPHTKDELDRVRALLMDARGETPVIAPADTPLAIAPPAPDIYTDEDVAKNWRAMTPAQQARVLRMGGTKKSDREWLPEGSSQLQMAKLLQRCDVLMLSRFFYVLTPLGERLAKYGATKKP